MRLIIFQIRMVNSQTVKIQNIVITTLSVYPGMLYQLLKINIFTTSQNSINKNASLFEKYIFFIITMQ